MLALDDATAGLVAGCVAVAVWTLSWLWRRRVLQLLHRIQALLERRRDDDGP